MHSLAVALGLALANCPVSFGVSEETSSAGGKTIKVLGQSGKFTYYSKDEGESDPNKITVLMDSLKEVDESGASVGSGSEKHAIETFASQSFTFDLVKSVTVGNATASKISFKAQVSTVGTLRVDTFLFTSNGTAGPTGTEWRISEGDLKFNVVFESWKFCNPCKAGKDEQVGKFIDFVISVKGKSDSTSKGSSKGSEESYDLGGGMELELTKKVEIDGALTDMPEGYPKLSTKGSSQFFEFRFPKFQTSATYDPLLAQAVSAAMSMYPSGMVVLVLVALAQWW